MVCVESIFGSALVFPDWMLESSEVCHLIDCITWQVAHYDYFCYRHYVQLFLNSFKQY